MTDTGVVLVYIDLVWPTSLWFRRGTDRDIHRVRVLSSLALSASLLHVSGTSMCWSVQMCVAVRDVRCLNVKVGMGWIFVYVDVTWTLRHLV